MELPLPADLKKKRQELGFTQNELAMLAGVSQPMVAKIEWETLTLDCRRSAASWMRLTMHKPSGARRLIL